MLKVGDKAGRYRVEAVVGRGGMATVYRVRHETLGGVYALKVLALTSVEDRLRQEGRVQARLRHPNLVSVHDVIIHPRTNDVILGTHGRALWIFDDATPIQLLDEVGEAPAHLFPTTPGLRFAGTFTRYGIGDREFSGPNPPYEAKETSHRHRV